MTYFTDNPLERLMVQVPEPPRREYDAPAVALSEAIGVCPYCGGRVVETQESFSCKTKDCDFALWKNSRFFTSHKKQLTKAVVAALLKEGSVLLHGCYSEKSGQSYDAIATLNDKGKIITYKLLFEGGNNHVHKHK